MDNISAVAMIYTPFYLVAPWSRCDLCDVERASDEMMITVFDNFYWWLLIEQMNFNSEKIDHVSETLSVW